MSLIILSITSLTFLNANNVIDYCSGKYLNVHYCAYFKGSAESNIIINSPHGGFLKPISIKDRKAGCYINGACVWNHDCDVPDKDNCGASTSPDMYTMEIAFLLRDKLEKLTGFKPHMIISYLHRRKLDPNRKINLATFGESEAVTAYNEIDDFIQTARTNISGNGLFIDIHGHVHSSQLTEFGYLIYKSRLNSNTIVPKQSSLKYLNTRLQAPTTFEDVLRGSESLGKYLFEQGFESVPSPQHKSPGSNTYFSGDHILKTYGSKFDGGMIDGVQVEIHKKERNEKKAQAYVNALGKAIYNFMDENDY